MSAVLFMVNGFEFVDSYQRDLSTYSFRVVDEWNRRNTTGVNIYKKPNPLRFCTMGEEQVQTKYLGINAAEDVYPPQPSMFYDNDKLPDVKSIDWAFIIKVIFGLFGVILVFDSISGEKERGTLRLICSNSIPRHQILLGKYLAAMIIITIPLIWGMLISLIITGSSSSFMLTGGEFWRIFLLMGISLTYISLIVLMSLSVSSIAHQSVTSLLILLFTLILMVMIIPNVAGILASEFTKTKSEYQLVKMWDANEKERMDDEDELKRQVREGFLKTEEEIVQKFRELDWKYLDNWFQLLYDHLQSINTQIKLARDLAKISPSAVFQYANESLANSGPLSEEHFFQAARRYKDIYSDYVKSKVGEIVRVSAGYEVTMPDGSKMEIPGTAPKEYHGDMSDFPKFSMPPLPIKDSIKDSDWNITILVLWNIVLFLTAHVAFLKYDIR
jgi:ABC-2 type transport system permease protein